MTIPASDMTVLDHLLAINLDVSLWTARKKLQPEDFGGVELPPEDLVSLGSKRICDPEKLTVFSTLKSRAVALLNRYGIRFLGGWAIPEDKADQLIAGLCAIRDEFNDEKNRFLASYDAAIADWVSRHPHWAKVISASTVSCDTVRAKLGFCWQLFRVAPMLQSAGEEAVQHSGLMEEVEGLANALFTDIAKDADEMWSKVYLGKTTVTHKALSPLRTLQQKLEGLSFVEPHVAPVAELIRTALEKVKRKGNIEGADLLMLQGLVCLLREPDALVVHAQRLIEGHDASTLLWDAALPEQKKQARAHRQPAPVLADSMGLW